MSHLEVAIVIDEDFEYDCRGRVELTVYNL